MFAGPLNASNEPVTQQKKKQLVVGEICDEWQWGNRNKDGEGGTYQPA
jgi:hypothetical protein